MSFPFTACINYTLNRHSRFARDIYGYGGAGHKVLVWTYTPGPGWQVWGDDIPVTFVDGDVLGARAFLNGWVEIYKNGALIGRRDLSTWEFSSSGGYIGMFFYHAWDAAMDDFGGGTVSGGQAMMSGMASGLQVDSSKEPAEFVVTSTLLNIKSGTDSAFAKGMPSQIGLKPYVLVPLNTPKTKYLTEKPNVEQQYEAVKVVYDIMGSRIQILRYDPVQGWVQFGDDIPVKFAEGDTFTASVNPEGVLEIHRNGKLLAARKLSFSIAPSQDNSPKSTGFGGGWAGVSPSLTPCQPPSNRR